MRRGVGCASRLAVPPRFFLSPVLFAIAHFFNLQKFLTFYSVLAGGLLPP